MTTATIISAELVRNLRDKTGARMMDCKQALSANDGDMEKASAWLKQKNLDRGNDAIEKPATEGLLGVKDFFQSGDRISIVEMSASTDFATKNQEFVGLLQNLANTAFAFQLNSVAELLPHPNSPEETFEDAVKNLAGKIGENIAVKRVACMSGEIGYYIHFDHKHAAVVELENVATKELVSKIGKDISMHIVFAKPKYLTRDEVPVSEVEVEKAIINARLQDDPKNKNKPPQIIEKIVTGQLGKFYGQTVLLDQPYYKDDKKTVAEILKELGDVKIKKFVRFQVGVI